MLDLLNRVRESRHQNMLEWYGTKFYRLCQKITGGQQVHVNFNSGCSNHTRNNSTTTKGTKTNDCTTTTTTTSTMNTSRVNWTKNLSSLPLMEAQESFLTRGPNYTVVLLYLPKGEYVTLVEKVCYKYNHEVVEELKV